MNLVTETITSCFYCLDAIYLLTQFCSPFRVIQNIADMKPKTRYIVATDDSQPTLDEIVKVSSSPSPPCFPLFTSFLPSLHLLPTLS